MCGVKVLNSGPSPPAWGQLGPVAAVHGLAGEVSLVPWSLRRVSSVCNGRSSSEQLELRVWDDPGIRWNAAPERGAPPRTPTLPSPRLTSEQFPSRSRWHHDQGSPAATARYSESARLAAWDPPNIFYQIILSDGESRRAVRSRCWQTRPNGVTPAIPRPTRRFWAPGSPFNSHDSDIGVVRRAV